MLNINNYNFTLPKELIAQSPANKRDESRFMIIDNHNILHKKFKDILKILQKDDILILNQAKVSNSKLIGTKINGGHAEIIIEQNLSKTTCLARINSSKTRINQIINIKEFKCQIEEKINDQYKIKFNENIEIILNKYGLLPTPPYIKKEIKDYSRYQTKYAKNSGSLAAPTAGLHFTENLLEKIKSKGVKIIYITLNIGFGTFLEINKKNIEEKKITQRNILNFKRICKYNK
jgi:S-adenosylmethionine:tRNA ribosyltransferase-isomerase